MRCDLQGQVAVVTGAAGAIGSAIARRLADNGAAVVIADIDLPGAEAMARSLPDALAVAVDIRDPASVEAAVERTFASRLTVGPLNHNASLAVISIDHDGRLVAVTEWTFTPDQQILVTRATV